MRPSVSLTIISFLAVGAVAGLSRERDNDDGGHPRICPHLPVEGGGCIRYTRGFDVTGVVTEVDLTFKDGIKSECDCIQACLSRLSTCANYVWKFSTPESVLSGHRTCTLYSDFSLPSAVDIEFDLSSANNSNINAAEIIANGNNPHNGSPVPQVFKDKGLNQTPDWDAVSGPVWQLTNKHVQC